MKTRPIIFSGEMVRAILEDRKTQTRRVLRFQLESVAEIEFNSRLGLWQASGDRPTNFNGGVQMNDWLTSFPCPFGLVGDQLWVRETWMAEWGGSQEQGDEYPLFGVRYKADDKWEEQKCPPVENSRWYSRWVPSIHMPTWASRITLEITDLRVERLQEITEDDANAEGFASHLSVQTLTPARLDFAFYWDSLNTKRGFPWSRNPWVWAITFKRIKP